MAIVSVDSSKQNLQFETMSLVDIRLLSQSELNSLSLCSDEAFDLARCDDVVIPKIDRTVFNESAGSRKQTYSRLRLTPRKPEITTVGRRVRCAGLLPLPKPPPDPVDDPERKENKRIATLLRELLSNGNSVKTDLIPFDSEIREPPIQPQPISSFKVENVIPLQQFPDIVSCKEVKKRGRKRKHELQPPQVGGDSSSTVANSSIVVYNNGSNATKEQTREIVNRNGVAVDVVALANLQDPFGPELIRRTAGLETETALLGFLKNLSGQWGSRRKKRKIVDASDFGDALPKGWKLLLTLKRREGRVWLNCRRYISPSGHQFVTCKEVSSFLMSKFASQDSSLQNYDHGDWIVQQTQKLASQTNAGITCQDDSSMEDPVCNSTQMIVHTNDHDKKVAILGVENLAEVQVRDLLECHKCNLAFEEKDAYLHHLLSSHQRSAKRCRIGSSISDGVIIKDGKFECQFCHKIFEERHRYNGHVGIHVRNYVRNLEVLPHPNAARKGINRLSSGSVPSGFHMMDSSFNINKGSIPEITTTKPSDGLNVGSVHCRLNVISADATPAESNCERMHHSSDSNQVAKASKNSIPEVSDTKRNELNVGSLHSKLQATSILKTPTSESICELSTDSSPSKQIADAYKDCIPDTTVATLNDGQNVSFLCTEQDPSSISQPLPGVPTYELNDASQGNLVKEVRKECGTETSGTKLGYQLNAGSFHTKPGKVLIQETPVDESNIRLKFDIYHSKLITEANEDSIPEASTAQFFDSNNVGELHNIPDENSSGKSNRDLNASSFHEKLVMQPNKIQVMLSCDSKSLNSKLTMVGEAKDVGNDKFLHCLDSGAPYYNQKDCSTFDTCDGTNSYAVTSNKSDERGIDLERLSGICSPTPVNQQIRRLDGVVLASVTEGTKLDKAYKSENSELQSGFGRYNAGPNMDVLTEAIWIADKQNVPEDRVADPSLPLKQSSGCNDELGSGFDSYDADPNQDIATEPMRTADGGNVSEDGVVESSLPLMQPSGCFTDPYMILDKGADEFCNVKKLENKSGFEELRVDDTEAIQFSFMPMPESRSPLEESMGFANNAVPEQEVDSTAQIDHEVVSLITASTNQPTTVCVWCRMEFNHEAVNSEMLSDSFAFMCPVCRVKISGCNTTEDMQEG